LLQKSQHNQKIAIIAKNPYINQNTIIIVTYG
jgi:hypothetical protein